MNINKEIFEVKGIKQAKAMCNAIDSASDNDVLSVTRSTINAIMDKCSEDDKFMISSDRRVGNNWNSTIEGLYRSNGKLFVDVYIQGDSTDTEESEYYERFFSYGRVSVRSEHLGCTATYDERDKAKVMRSILKEYLYYAFIEKADRLLQKKVSKLMDWRIVNPILNYYYDYYKLRYSSSPYNRYTSDSTIINDKAYHYASNHLNEYVRANVKELSKKNTDELTKLYKTEFERLMNEFKKTFNVNEYRKSLVLW